MFNHVRKKGSFLLFLILICSCSGAGENTLIVTASSGLNVREGPNKNYRKIATLSNGIMIEYIGSVGNWEKIRHSSGITGWVYGKYTRPTFWNEILGSGKVYIEFRPYLIPLILYFDSAGNASISVRASRIPTPAGIFEVGLKKKYKRKHKLTIIRNDKLVKAYYLDDDKNYYIQKIENVHGDITIEIDNGNITIRIYDKLPANH